jgi:hypothetical protein
VKIMKSAFPLKPDENEKTAAQIAAGAGLVAIVGGLLLARYQPKKDTVGKAAMRSAGSGFLLYLGTKALETGVELGLDYLDKKNYASAYRSR